MSRAYVDLGIADMNTMGQYGGRASSIRFTATDEGLTMSWGDPNMRLFFAWDFVEVEKPDTAAPTVGKAQIQFGMGAHDETETLPGLDNDIRKWTDEAQDET